ncbi:hypothetical protein M409DRAFT_27304 [Zasmidium cellare ATCC 36951]|uniref:Nuclear fusion protein KAR5 n=1 Tax=Zasmidium cellare ATCC 36951 TaxID=1080233 RepID=A0A6A6C7X1_ZASCE|nr:uncharacterized protein M409DRAFT_27304 [Zasmidium cellare ATCC 36951]KAF2162300.1 hypothetical protein M409DRAFT_27304 [Zasmidium cellare ATCC 36951]
MSFAVFVSQILLACTLVLSLQQGTQVHAGWLSSAPTVPELGIEPNVTLTGYIAEVQATLQSLESKPACSRLAHKTLLNACGAYDRNSNQAFRSTDEAVKTFRDVFAIQMTACEMDEAQQEMPATCQPLLQPLAQDPRPYISDCLSSLHDSINPWTSYVHNKDSGDVMCFAMRAEMDKDEQLDNFRKMIAALQNIGYVIQDHGMTIDQILQLSKGLQTQVRESFILLQHETEQYHASIKQSFSEVAKDMSLMGQGVHSLLNSVGQVDQGLQQHLVQVKKIFERMVSLGTNVETYSTGVAIAREEFGELQARVQLQYQQMLEDVFKRVYELTADVTRANEGVASLAGLVASINTGMDSTFFALQGISIAADGVQYKMGDIHTQLDEMALQANDTQETMLLFNEQVEKIHSWATIGSGLLEGFISTTKCVSDFGLYYATATGLVMLCLSCLGIKLRYAMIVSALLGFTVAHIFLLPLVSLIKTNPTADTVFEEGVDVRWQFLLYGACFCMLVGAVIKTVFDQLIERHRPKDRDIEYDPASPSYLPSTEKYRI